MQNTLNSYIGYMGKGEFYNEISTTHTA